MELHRHRIKIIFISLLCKLVAREGELIFWEILSCRMVVRRTWPGLNTVELAERFTTAPQLRLTIHWATLLEPVKLELVYLCYRKNWKRFCDVCSSVSLLIDTVDRHSSLIINICYVRKCLLLSKRPFFERKYIPKCRITFPILLIEMNDKITNEFRLSLVHPREVENILS